MVHPKAGIKLHFLQALRAIAAWLVVADHALLDFTHGDLKKPGTFVAWALGDTGVYIFFVISGFIMVHICWEDFGRHSAAPNFLRRRIVRIVPLYWLATIAAFVFHNVSGTHISHAGWSEVVRSLLFIPYQNEDGAWAPILGQGWTLNYEMMFYAIFAVSLVFERRVALPAITSALVLVSLVGGLVPTGILAYLCSPIVLWFVLGMALAVFWRWRDFGEPKRLAQSAKFFEPLGDASYSTYLVHGFALTILLRVWEAQSAWFIATSLVGATAIGLGVHMIVERPLLRATNLWTPRSSAVPRRS